MVRLDLDGDEARALFEAAAPGFAGSDNERNWSHGDWQALRRALRKLELQLLNERI